MRLILLLTLTFFVSSYTNINLLLFNETDLYGTGAAGNVTMGSTTLPNNGSVFQYENLTIPSGVTVYLGNDGNDYAENVVVIKVKGTFTLNGTIQGIYGSHSINEVSTNIGGIKLSKANPQQPGGAGGNGHGNLCGGGGQSDGNGGGASGGRSEYGTGVCGGGASVVSGGAGGFSYGCGYDTNGTPGGSPAYVYGGTGGAGGDGGPSECGSGGGGGGSRGYHGATLVIIAKKIVGNGYIDLHGSNGGNGGQAGSVPGHWNTGSYHGGGRGGTGGGGAGGNGGTVFFVSDQNNFSGSFNISPGSGGSAGPQGSGGGAGWIGGYGGGGSNGIAGSVINVNLEKKN